MAAAAIWKSKNRNISAADGIVLSKFGMVMCLHPLDHLRIQNFMLLKIQHGTISKIYNMISLKSFAPISAEV